MSTTTAQFACPVCGYDQRGLIASWTDRCPLNGACSECGSTIDWQELHRPDLFEQTRYYEHPKSGSLGDLITTIRRAFLPGALWRWIPRSQPLAPRRLLGVSLRGVVAVALVAVFLIPALGLGSIYALYFGVTAPPIVAQNSSYHPLSFASDFVSNDVPVYGSVWIIALAFHVTTVFVASAWALLARSRGVRLRHILRFAMLTPIPLTLLLVLDSAINVVEAMYQYEFLYIGTGYLAVLGALLNMVHGDLFAAAVFLATLAWLWHAWVMFMTRYLRAARPRLTVLAYGLMSLLLVPLWGGALAAIFW